MPQSSEAALFNFTTQTLRIFLLGCGLSEGLVLPICFGLQREKSPDGRGKCSERLVCILLTKAGSTACLLCILHWRDFSHGATSNCKGDGKCSLALPSEK